MKRHGRPDLHPDVTEISHGGGAVSLEASKAERDRFEAAVLEHRDFVVEVAEQSGFTEARLVVDHGPGASLARFSGRWQGRTFEFQVARTVNPTSGLAADLVAVLIADLIVKVRTVPSTNPLEAPTLKLYWVADEQNEDDWFVVARTARDAKQFYCTHFGDSPGAGATHRCEKVCELPADLQKVDDAVFNIFDSRGAGWPTHETVKACGGDFLSEEQPRVVKLGGRTFAEGMLDSIVERARRGQRPDPQ